MNDIKVITRDTIPCWYELGWRTEDAAIVLRIHKEFISANPIAVDAPIVLGLKEEFGFSKFTSFDEKFGFDDSFILANKQEGFLEFIAKLPAVKKETDEKCERCDGSGKDDFDECLSCSGTGKKEFFDWQAANAISATLSVFSALARFPKIQTSALFPQLMTIQNLISRDGNRLYFGLAGEYSDFLARWMSSFGTHTEITEMIEAMKTAYNRMLGLHEFHKFDFCARIDSDYGWLNISCPGDACGLNPVYGADFNMKKGLGYDFVDHNLDSSAQQLTLLAGLAALYDKARREIKKY